MSVSDVLNTDVAVVGERLRGALAWWIDELRQLAGPLASSRGGAAGLTAERREDGGYALLRDGRAVGVHAPGDAPLAAALVLSPNLALVREAPAPPLPDRDVRRMLALDIDRLTPFRPEAVYVAMRPGPPATVGGPRPWRLAVAPREAADRAVSEARAAGLQPTAVLAGPPRDAIDLLPAMRAANRAGVGVSPVARLWLVVAVLLAANVAAAIWRDVRSTDAVVSAAAEQQPVADKVLRLRRRLEAVDRATAAQLAARDAHEPLRVLDALTRALGDDVWVRRLTLDDGGVRIAGDRREGADPITMLRRSTAFAEVRDLGADSSDPAAYDVAARTLPQTAARAP